MIVNSSSQEKLMRQMQSYDFAVYDTLLYLDAYPDSREALNAYNKYKRLSQKARAEYEQKYGPVTHPQETSKWSWTDTPWPWQTDERR